VLLLGLAAAAPAQQLSGKGEWQSLSSAIIKGEWTVSLVRNGKRIEGTINLGGTSPLDGSAVSGSINASNIVLGAVANGTHEATFTGKLDGTSVAGEWDCPSVKDHGIWYGTLGPADAVTP
jgi:hypothetical protein